MYNFYFFEILVYKDFGYFYGKFIILGFFVFLNLSMVNNLFKYDIV